MSLWTQVIVLPCCFQISKHAQNPNFTYSFNTIAQWLGLLQGTSHKNDLTWTKFQVALVLTVVRCPCTGFFFKTPYTTWKNLLTSISLGDLFVTCQQFSNSKPCITIITQNENKLAFVFFFLSFTAHPLFFLFLINLIFILVIFFLSW